MNTVHILNPAAGQGAALKFNALDNVYITKDRGDATQYIQKLGSDPVKLCVYGGDGTVNEAVSGILQSENKSIDLCICPTGTGNDLARTIAEYDGDVIKADVLTLNDGYAVNAINTGFDLSVVLRAAEFKKLPFVSGSMAYILGIVTTLFGKMGQRMKITYTDVNGKTEVFEEECLLAVAAKGRYYGGGFKASPAADLTDGCIDLTIVRKVSRLKFINLVAKYKKGKHIDIKALKPFCEFDKILIYKKCKNVVIEGIEDICADGEVFKTQSAKIGIIPNALKIVK